MPRVAFKYDEDLKFIADFMVPAQDMMASFQEAEFDDEALYLDKIQGYKIYYKDLMPHMTFDEETWNKYLKSQEVDEQVEAGQEMFNELAKAYTLDMATDEQAYVMRYLYDQFDPDGHPYEKDDRFMYNDKFYKVLQDHASQADWLPTNAPSLYVEITDPAEEWPEWKQPTGAHDAYNTGDKVSHNGEKYISQIDGNTVEPGTDERYWKKVVEEETTDDKQ